MKIKDLKSFDTLSGKILDFSSLSNDQLVNCPIKIGMLQSTWQMGNNRGMFVKGIDDSKRVYPIFNVTFEQFFNLEVLNESKAD